MITPVGWLLLVLVFCGFFPLKRTIEGWSSLLICTSIKLGADPIQLACKYNYDHDLGSIVLAVQDNDCHHQIKLTQYEEE